MAPNGAAPWNALETGGSSQLEQRFSGGNSLFSCFKGTEKTTTTIILEISVMSQTEQHLLCFSRRLPTEG